MYQRLTAYNIKLKLFLVPAVLLCIFITLPASAQEEGQTDEDLLPDIDPQEIEIRGEYRPSFPGLRRQPILGFEPEPSVYQIDPKRQPYMESGEDIMADLPVSELDRPSPPAIKMMNLPEQNRGYTEVGIGRYLSPRASTYLWTPVNKKGYLYGDIEHFSTDGHLDSQPSSFRFLDGSATYVHRNNKDRRWMLTASGLSSFNHVFPVDTAGSFYPDVTPGKAYKGFEVQSRFLERSSNFDGWELDAGYRYYEVDFEADSLSDQSREHVLNASLSRQWSGTHQHEVYGARVATEMSAYERSSARNDNWYTITGELYYDRLFGYSTRLNATLGINYAVNSLFDDKLYVTPHLIMKHWVNENIRLKVDAGMDVYTTTLKEHHEKNRLLKVNNFIAQSYLWFGTAQGEWHIMEQAVLRAGFTYKRIQDYFYYERLNHDTRQSMLLWYQNDVDDATIRKPFVGLSIDLIPESWWIDSKVYYNSTSLENDYDTIPFEEDFGAKVSTTYQITDQLNISGRLNVLGPRFDADSNDKLDTVALLGAGVDYSLSPRWSAFLDADNILNQEYEIWQGYQERDLEVFVGVTYNF